MSIDNRLISLWMNALVLGVFLLIVSVSSTFLFYTYDAHAAPGKINYQGRLTDAAGTAKPDGQYNMKFRIYDAASSGTLLWSEIRETANRVTVTNGQFSVQLGAVTSVPSSVFSGDSTYFEVELPTPATATCSTASCGAYTEGAMSPRQPVSSSAYALKANDASTIDGIDSTAFGTLAGSNSWAGLNTFAGNAIFNGTAKSTLDNTAAFSVSTSGLEALFNIDTVNKAVSIGTGASGTTYFGTNTIGAQQDTGDYDNMNFSRFQTGLTAGTTSQASVYMAGPINTYPNNKFTIAIYSGTTTTPTTRIAVSTEGAMSVGWNTVQITATLSPSTYYWVGYNSNGTGVPEGNNMSYDQTGTSFYKANTYTNGWPSTMTGGTTGGDQNFSMYVDFAGVGAAITTTNSGNVGINTTTPSSTLDVAGTARFKSKTNSATAFQITNAAVESLFVADTSNNRIQIGSAAADATAVVLVLDTKNTSGDPTGVAGAMYYNSNAGKFRCYEGGAWKDCISASSTDGRTSLVEKDDFLHTTAVSQIFTGAVAGTGAARTVVASVANHPGITNLSAGTTATGTSSILSEPQAVLLGNANVWTFNASVRLPTALSDPTNGYYIRVGFQDSATTDAVDGCYFRYIHSTNAGKWQGVCRSNNTESVCDLGVIVATATWYNLQVGVNAAGNSTTFVVNGTSNCAVTTNIPIVAGRQTGVGAMIGKTIGVTARTLDVDYIAFSATGMSR